MIPQDDQKSQLIRTKIATSNKDGIGAQVAVGELGVRVQEGDRLHELVEADQGLVNGEHGQMQRQRRHWLRNNYQTLLEFHQMSTTEHENLFHKRTRPKSSTSSTPVDREMVVLRLSHLGSSVR